jgi:DNA-binding transcriptional LysR family regulator
VSAAIRPWHPRIVLPFPPPSEILAGGPLADLLHGRVELRLPPPGDEDARALRREPPRRREADPRCAACDNRYLLLEFVAHGVRPLIAALNVAGPLESEAIVAEAQGEPQGLVRLSCPTGMMDLVGPIAGLGVALLPDHIAAADLRAGKLVRVFPEWYVTEGIVHLVFTSRRGLPPAVRALIEHLASHIHDDVMKEGID